jgi:hypothetical protein
MRITIFPQIGCYRLHLYSTLEMARLLKRIVCTGVKDRKAGQEVSENVYKKNNRW